MTRAAKVTISSEVLMQLLGFDPLEYKEDLRISEAKVKNTWRWLQPDIELTFEGGFLPDEFYVGFGEEIKEGMIEATRLVVGSKIKKV